MKEKKGVSKTVAQAKFGLITVLIVAGLYYTVFKT
tara:strand:+ start:1860 stop:1964 length:105 start_codon:yes stop_codon:yes gene_type:complete